MDHFKLSAPKWVMSAVQGAEPGSSGDVGAVRGPHLSSPVRGRIPAAWSSLIANTTPLFIFLTTFPPRSKLGLPL